MSAVPHLNLSKVEETSTTTTNKPHSPRGADVVKSPRKHTHDDSVKSPRHGDDSVKSPRTSKHEHHGDDNVKSPRTSKHEHEHHHSHRHEHSHEHDANAHMHKAPFDELVKSLDDPERNKTLPLDTLVPKVR